MTLLFLDLDGVVNGESFDYEPLEKQIENETYVPELVRNINYIIDRYKMDVVISSSWRIARTREQLETVLKGIGLVANIHGVTEHDNQPRHKQIWDYLNKHKVCNNNYIIIDDDSDAFHDYHAYCFQTDVTVGFDNKALTNFLNRFTMFDQKFNVLLNSLK